MIKFDPQQLRVVHCLLKDCTTALGGAIRIVDELTSTPEKENYKRIATPLALVRAFQLRYGMSKYLNAVEVALVYYEDHIVAIERHVLGNLGVRELDVNGEIIKWIPGCTKRIDNFVIPTTSTGDWYIDGKYVYRFAHNSVARCVQDSTHLTKDGKYRALTVEAINLSTLSGTASEDEMKSPGFVDSVDTCDINKRWCLSFVARNGRYVVTPPIWTNMKIGGLIIASATADVPRFQLEEINEKMSVNVAFALSAGKTVGTLFGHEAIEPLCLEDIMIRLQTVNIPKVPKAVKNTFDINMSLLQALAWTIGLTGRSSNLTELIEIRSLLKYLTTKGLFTSAIFDSKSVYLDGNANDVIPMLDVEAYSEIAENTSATDFANLLESAHRRTAVNTIKYDEEYDNE